MCSFYFGENGKDVTSKEILCICLLIHELRQYINSVATNTITMSSILIWNQLEKKVGKISTMQITKTNYITVHGDWGGIRYITM